MSKPTRWSYSSLSTYESCPAKWKYSYLDNLPGQPSAAMARGSRLHADCENYVKGDLQVLPFELKKVALRIEGYRQAKAKPEDVWVLDYEWIPNPITPWIKGIIDIHWISPDGKTLHVIDYKSGREYPEHREQLELYALMGMCVYPEVKRAEYGALYLDTGHTSNEGALIRGDMMESKMESWSLRAIKIFEDNEYKATPSQSACRWCDYHKSKGGPCLVGV